MVKYQKEIERWLTEASHVLGDYYDAILPIF